MLVEVELSTVAMANQLAHYEDEDWCGGRPKFRTRLGHRVYEQRRQVRAWTIALRHPLVPNDRQLDTSPGVVQLVDSDGRERWRSWQTAIDRKRGKRPSLGSGINLWLKAYAVQV